MSLLQMSFSGAVLIIAVIVIRAFTLHKLPKITFLILWWIALARLLIPFSIPSILSVYSFIRTDTAACIPSDSINAATYKSVYTFINELTYAPVDDAVYGLNEAGNASTKETITALADILKNISPWTLVRLVGTAICMLFFIISYCRCRFAFQTSLPVQNDFVKHWLDTHSLHRTIRIRESDRILTPLTYGIVKPVILLPKKTDWTNTVQLRYILLHEYVHIRRLDALTKLLIAFALCIHWFNPLVWAMYFLFNRDMELACDESVLHRLGETSKSAYAFMLIGMEEQKNAFMPFCNNFNINAAEERITAIMKIKKTSLPAVLIAAALIIFTTTAFATSAADRPAPSQSGKSMSGSPDSNFSKEDFDKLLSLQFNGYKDMSVSEYQKRVWQTTDTKEYSDLLERFLADERLYSIYETKEYGDNMETQMAYFLYNILSPLTAENWSSRIFRGYSISEPAQAKYPDAADNASLEYSITLTILDPDSLTVGEYDTARSGLVSGLADIMQSKNMEQLQDETYMQKALASETKLLTEKWSTGKLRADIAYFYTPLVLSDKGGKDTISSPNNEANAERHGYPNGTESDYRSLFALKTADYPNMSVADFNAALLVWADENYERMERIDIDRALQDYAVSLSDEEMTFVSLTVWASGMENGEYVRSIKKSEPEKDPVVTIHFPDKIEYGNGYELAYCSMEYAFSYHIADKESVTIRERDRCVGSMMNAVQQFWENTDINNALAMNKEDISKRLEEISAQYSSDKVIINVLPDKVFYESMDERNIE
ncbi:MAG: M56 family metallopeptidase [Bacillus sp. (in: Bacteria)]|nr:M56 family metallopeptidase [Bacillus sp. (in: firmicutes)]MCM1425577.1 M56 family metallopeptidase [Eubacterium sp.]